MIDPTDQQAAKSARLPIGRTTHIVQAMEAVPHDPIPRALESFMAIDVDDSHVVDMQIDNRGPMVTGPRWLAYSVSGAFRGQDVHPGARVKIMAARRFMDTPPGEFLVPVAAWIDHDADRKGVLALASFRRDYYTPEQVVYKMSCAVGMVLAMLERKYGGQGQAGGDEA